jgi:hypothetical protein
VGEIDIEEYGERYGTLRRQVEEAIRPLATSVDGRHFTCQLSPYDLSVRTGGYVVIESDDTDRLGQLLALDLDLIEGPQVSAPGEDRIAAPMRLRQVRGAGLVRAGGGEPFHDGLLRPAGADEVRDWLESIRPGRAELEIGSLQLVEGVPFRLDAGGFDRHTFLCGQSGSGKTYSLGVVLERLLLETDLRIVLLDPNSDFVKLGSARDGVDRDVAERYGGRAEVLVRRSSPDGADRLALRFPELDPRIQAAAVRLDPVDDRAEYAELVSLVETIAVRTGEVSLEELFASGGDELRALGQRVSNLGLARWRLWSRDDPVSLVEDLTDGDWRCLVVDLGSLETLEEKALAAEATLATLWRNRSDRRPTLIVVDEAHNVCPAEPPDPITAIAAEHAARIAAEGRKFGLYLLVSTQRPQKIDEHVLSQCDNLVLMRMNSVSDLEYVGELFSFVPGALLRQATDFRLGEALVAGKITSHPALLRFGARISAEGGSDVPADWAERR